MIDIIDIKAREILNSRGRPTVEVDVRLSDGSMGRASIPNGSSKGQYEALEHLDNDKNRYGGCGVLRVVETINGEIFNHLVGHPAENQRLIDELLIHLDGTENKSRLGANAILGVSLAVAKASAQAFKMPLYRYIGGVNAHVLPTPMMNILNGGMHADNNLSFQEFMIIPTGGFTFSDSLRMGSEIFYALKTHLKKQGHFVGVGDEGGFSPRLKSEKEALDCILTAVQTAGFSVGQDILLGLDIAATTFYQDNRYYLNHRKYTSEKIIDYYENLILDYPILSIEDAMAEDDWEGWQLLTERLANKVQLVGDDLFVTNIKRLEQGLTKNVANAILIKPNQIGTLTETLDTVSLAQKSGYNVILSHRSGETEDTVIADISVATNCGQIKTGSLSRTERLAKYNQLIRIEENLGPSSFYAGRNPFLKFKV